MRERCSTRATWRDELAPIGEVNLQMASAYVAWNAGSDLVGASAHLERAAKAAERLPPTVERDHVRAAAGALFHRAELSCLHGDPAAALQTLGRARGVCSTGCVTNRTIC